MPAQLRGTVKLMAGPGRMAQKKEKRLAPHLIPGAELPGKTPIPMIPDLSITKVLGSRLGGSHQQGRRFPGNFPGRRIKRYSINADIDTAGGAWKDKNKTGWAHNTDIGLFKSDVTTDVTLKLSAVNGPIAHFGITVFTGMDTGTDYTHHTRGITRRHSLYQRTTRLKLMTFNTLAAWVLIAQTMSRICSTSLQLTALPLKPRLERFIPSTWEGTWVNIGINNMTVTG